MHKHLVLTAIVEDPPKDPLVIEKFLYNLVERVNMEVLIPPHAVYCEDVYNSGVTGTVVITTSHASVHIWDNVPTNPYPGLFQMDLYSCKDFVEADVLKFVEEFFDAQIVRSTTIDRGLPAYASPRQKG